MKPVNYYCVFILMRKGVANLSFGKNLNTGLFTNKKKHFIGSYHHIFRIFFNVYIIILRHYPLPMKLIERCYHNSRGGANTLNILVKNRNRYFDVQ